MSIVDRFYNARHGSNDEKPKREAQGFQGALSFFNENLSKTGQNLENRHLRQPDETVVEWEQRVREEERTNHGKGEYEPLYADQYTTAQKNDKYEQDIREVEDRVSTQESHQSTGRGLDFQWSAGDIVPGDPMKTDLGHEMNVEIDESLLQKAVRDDLFSEQEAQEIMRKGGSIGLNSGDWS